MYTVHCPTNSVRCTVLFIPIQLVAQVDIVNTSDSSTVCISKIVRCTLNITHCTLYTIHYMQYTTQCTL